MTRNRNEDEQRKDQHMTPVASIFLLKKNLSFKLFFECLLEINSLSMTKNDS